MIMTKLKTCPLFRGMTDDEIEACLSDSRSIIKKYKKDEIIFSQGAKPVNITILISGSVVISNDSSMGKRTIMAIFRNPGELFGEVFLFLNKEEYDHYAQVLSEAEILLMPKEYIFAENAKNKYHSKLLANMLSIFASKSYYLNKRVQILSCGSLRQKIAKLILQETKDGKSANIRMNREELADFLNAARPSVSRELMKMQDEGLIEVQKDRIIIKNSDELLDL